MPRFKNFIVEAKAADSPRDSQKQLEFRNNHSVTSKTHPITKQVSSDLDFIDDSEFDFIITDDVDWSTSSPTSVSAPNPKVTPSIMKKRSFDANNSSVKKKIKSKVSFGKEVNFEKKSPLKQKITLKKLAAKKSTKHSKKYSSPSPKYHNVDYAITPSPPIPKHNNEGEFPSTSMKDVSPSVLPLPQRGICIDTRTLQTCIGESIGQMYLNNVASFLESCNAQGILPSVLSRTVLKDVKMKGKSTLRPSQACIEAKAIRTSLVKNYRFSTSSQDMKPDFEHLWKEVLSTIPIRPPVNLGNKNNRSAVHVPKRLLASDSWRIFGDLVDSMIDESTKSVKNKGSFIPLDVTLLTNDVSFFTDTKIDSHKRGLNRLWERIRQKFQAGLIRSVQIIVLETGILPLEQHPDIENLPSSPGIPQKLMLAKCIGVLSSRIEFLLDKESRLINEDTSVRGMPMSLNLEVMECHDILFRSLVQRWTRNSLKSSSKIRFDLPETLEGAQCSVSLDLKYATFPHKLDSPVARGLMLDIQLLSKSFFEVVQLVPLDLVDLSLIYGIPIVAKAGLEEDLDQYKEMQAIVHQLAHHLSCYDLALVLRSSSTTLESEMTLESHIFHSSPQVFLLMAEDEKGSSSQVPERRIILYRYISRAEWMLEVTTDERYGDEDSSNHQDEDDKNTIYSEYVRDSFELIERGELNPFLLHDPNENDDTNPLRCNDEVSETIPPNEENGDEERTNIKSPRLEHESESDDYCKHAEFDYDAYDLH